MTDPGRSQRRRRVVMQILLWLALGATVGLAALVNHAVVRPQRIEAAGLSVQLPRQWQVVEVEDPRLAMAAVDPEGGRVVALVRQRAAPGLGAYQYLRQSGLLPPEYQQGQTAGVVGQSPIRMAGQTGLLVIAVRISPQTGLPSSKLLAAVILPDREAVTIILESPGAPRQADALLIRQIADTLTVAPREE
jgi:hypothetical protein